MRKVKVKVKGNENVTILYAAFCRRACPICARDALALGNNTFDGKQKLP